MGGISAYMDPTRGRLSVSARIVCMIHSRGQRFIPMHFVVRRNIERIPLSTLTNVEGKNRASLNPEELPLCCSHQHSPMSVATLRSMFVLTIMVITWMRGLATHTTDSIVLLCPSVHQCLSVSFPKMIEQHWRT